MRHLTISATTLNVESLTQMVSRAVRDNSWIRLQIDPQVYNRLATGGLETLRAQSAAGPEQLALEAPAGKQTHYLLVVTGKPTGR